jgi:predicted nucleic acid-binding protein
LITLDTSAIYAILDRREQAHAAVVDTLTADRGPYFVPLGILAEIAYVVETKLGGHVLDAVLADIETGAYALDCGENDLPRIRHLIARYDSLPLGFSDAAVIACAERNGGRVLSVDARDFGVVAREGAITVLPG